MATADCQHEQLPHWILEERTEIMGTNVFIRIECKVCGRQGEVEIDLIPYLGEEIGEIDWFD